MQHDLRKDILYLTHNNQDHPSLAVTISNVREMCWFPDMIMYIREQRAEKVRRNVHTSDSTLAASKQRRSDLRVGDKVSFNGAPVTIADLFNFFPYLLRLASSTAFFSRSFIFVLWRKN